MNDLLEHPAVQAWSTLQPERVEPLGIERLKKEWKSRVYRLEGVGAAGSGVIAKRCKQTTALIERAIYQEILPQSPLPTLRYYGYVEDSDDGFAWLFLEDAGEEEGPTSGSEYRVLAAEWLAALHLAAVPPDLQARLPSRGSNHYLQELRFVRETLAALTHPALNAEDRVTIRSILSQCDFLESHWGPMERFHESMPRTVVHGDLIQENVRIRTGQYGAAFLPFDWEIAGWGTPAVDLAQFENESMGSEIPVNADIAAYASAVLGSWPHLDQQDLRQLAALGTIFWLLANIGWQCWNLMDGWVERAMRRIKVYEAGLAKCLGPSQAPWGPFCR
ncbi:MAG: aminoglycoside phosphotransferase family protein [Acidobacteria bacterium]|nr:aminoglycoside phosphotransferase family protein [Acidobacteriota bacterium]